MKMESLPAVANTGVRQNQQLEFNVLSAIMSTEETVEGETLLRAGSSRTEYSRLNVGLADCDGVV